jgi:DNA-binding GntR family transcriptional regulator
MNPSKKRTSHGSRPDQVYSRLRELIVQAQLAPGSRIIETEVAERLGVSRTPVREALQRLQQEGYVMSAEHSQQSRLTVAPLTRADVHELLNILGAIEGLAACTAAQYDPEPRAQLVSDLETANAAFLEAARTDTTGQTLLFEADERFHGAIVAAGAGPRLLALHQAVKPQAERYIRMYISLLVSDVDRSGGEHERIIQAIAAGDSDAAQRGVEQNWRHAADRLGRVIEVAGELGAW